MSIIIILAIAAVGIIITEAIKSCYNKASEFVNHINYKLTVRERRSRSQRRWVVSNA